MRLLSARFYAQIVRSQLEYGLAINSIPPTLLNQLEDCQKKCIRKLFGGVARSSYKIMLHLVNLPTMKERVHLLQAKFLQRTLTIPDDTLLFQFLSYIRISTSRSQWYKLSKSPVWKRCISSNDNSSDPRIFRSICKKYLADNLASRRNERNSKLLSACRGTLGIDPLLWLPMTNAERSRALRWRLGWLPGGVPKPCIYHPLAKFTRPHAIWCLHMHRRLQMPLTQPDPLSFLLNKLPTKFKKQTRLDFPAWQIRWPTICQLLFELDYLHHGKLPPDPPPLGTKLVSWLSSN